MRCSAPAAVVATWVALILGSCTGEDAAGGTAAGATPATPNRIRPGIVRDLQADWFEVLPDAASQFRFTHLVQGFFLSRGQRVALTGEGDLQVVATGAVHELDELARNVAELDPALWEQAIAAHFGQVDATLRGVTDAGTPDWEVVKPQLRVRLLSEEFLEQTGFDSTNALMRRDLPGLATCVMIDADRSATLVPRRDLETWQRPATGVFEVAIANTRAELDGRIQIVEQPAPGLGTLRALAGDSFYTASAVLWLEAWPELVGESGAFVVVPWWGAVFAWPFGEDADRRAVPGLHAIAEQMAAAEGEALSDAVYWRRPDGSFGRIRITRGGDGRLEIVPPADLADLLRGR